MDNCVRVSLGGCPATDEEGAEVQTDRKQITLHEAVPRRSQPFLTLPESVGLP